MGETDNLTIEKLNLNPRTINALNRNGVFLINDLIIVEAEGKLIHFSQIGEKSIFEIKICLDEFKKTQIRSLDPGSKNQVFGENNKISKRSYSSIFTSENGDKYNRTPISWLNLSVRIKHILLRNGVETLGILIYSILNGRLRKIKMIGGKSIEEIQKVAIDYINSSVMKTNSISREVKKHYDWASIIEPFFSSLSERNITILLLRFGCKKKTLQETASMLNITRERVRQIQGRVANNFFNHVEKNQKDELINIILASVSHLGDNFSPEKFKEELQGRNILGKLSSPIKCKLLGEVELFETLICWLAIASDEKYSSKYKLKDIYIESLRSSTAINSLKVINFVDKIPKLTNRKIVRRVLFTGGIRLHDVKKILSVSSDEITQLVLEHLDMFEIRDNWFSLKFIDDSNKKIPIRSAGLKMLGIVGEMDYEEFYDGLIKHAKRFYETIAPPDIVAHMLKILGFQISDKTISTRQLINNVFSKSEKCYIDAVKKNGNIVSFLEIAEEFMASGLSLPAAGRTLYTSPIAEKIDSGLYKIRGQKTNWYEEEAALKRQKKFSQNDEISYGLDGIIRLKITINSYAFLSGVINSYKIKDLSGGWNIYIDDNLCGKATMDGLFLWGLSNPFKKIDAQIGDRVELSFNTRNRILNVRKS